MSDSNLPTPPLRARANSPVLLGPCLLPADDTTTRNQLPNATSIVVSGTNLGGAGGANAPRPPTGGAASLINPAVSYSPRGLRPKYHRR